ncbi:Ig-like domain-containing protein [Streptomyces sp. DSM 41527]|uniref:Ig-like domain-containing protein n=2 Tax=Streptomyces mooreae TaxID=3075523 RepID=A0ABU2T279_9ACTN|nr:Ig-like domain-containing protein [Streptomyces sp. DSM 41527]MDT0455337.1 Ig-like domain-containing protein [Streptomyces sp. DSM 41527]
MLLLVTACGGDVDDGKGAGKAGGEKDASQAAVTIAPKDGAHDVATSGALKVTARKGRLKSVKVKDGKGNEVDGKTAGGGALWQPSGHLGASTEYTVDAIAVDGKGRETAEHSRFTTLVPKNTFIGQYTPENGQRVGVGMPVSIHFTRGITDPKAVEDAIKVTAKPSVPIEGHWFGNDRLDFRPEKYWAAGTEVTLKLDLNGVEGRPGVYGTQAKEVSFTVGRSQVSTVDAASKKMTVVRDGKKIKTIPITSGAPGTETYNGKMVISEKHLVTRMNGDTVGFGGEYDIKDVPHAMRLSTSGTFIHGNYWSGSAAFGTRNASHGCVGLFDQRGGGDSSTPAAWFFRNSVVGDVVVVKNSHDETIQPDNGFSDWNLSWEKWKARQ